ncbi:uncharacterized protein MAM_04995 [Metarhizium album ARSEF 1941]|uniref:Uncharacterized protein n=1 Tax=Metarhizium album (strain ARSEF 1941) TaxID=1081103 RepID=A0A0B2WTM2_METAS|nr:uncharacterized protein MAM_04995 [Metarhizium album ARSEF 1941]KHN97398.1 hypothetical protein MAM_04995 [Metarhizium album ARSEF 1941]
MAVVAEIQWLQVVLTNALGSIEYMSGDSVQADVKEDALRSISNLSEEVKIFLKNHNEGIHTREVAALETQLQVSESEQAALRRELDQLRETFESRLAERVSRELDSRFIALAKEIRRGMPKRPLPDGARTAPLRDGKASLRDEEEVGGPRRGIECPVVAKRADIERHQMALRGLRSKRDVESAVSSLETAATNRQHRLGDLAQCQLEALSALHGAVDKVESEVGLIKKVGRDRHEAVGLALGIIRQYVADIDRRLCVEGGPGSQQTAERVVELVGGLSDIVDRLPTQENLSQSVRELGSDLRGAFDGGDGFVTHEVFCAFVQEFRGIMPEASSLLSQEQVHAAIHDGVSDLVTRSDLRAFGLMVDANTAADLLRPSPAEACFLNLASRVSTLGRDVARTEGLVTLAVKVDAIDTALADAELATKADVAGLADTLSQANSARDNVVQKQDVAALSDKVDALDAKLTGSDLARRSDLTARSTRVLSNDLDREVASQEV